MSTRPEDVNAQMAQQASESLAYRQALSTPPPNAADLKQNPQLSTLGLDLLAPHLSAHGFDALLTILHWAIHSQNLSDGKPVQWTDATFAMMQAPFVGFGNPHIWQNVYSTNIGVIVHSMFLNWHGRGSRFRRENPLPILILREVAPLIANQSKGWEHMQEVNNLLHTPGITDQLS